MSSYPVNRFNQGSFMNSNVPPRIASPQLPQSTVFPFPHSFLSFPPPILPAAQHVVSNGQPGPGNNFCPPPISPFQTNIQQFANTNSIELRTSNCFERNGVGTPSHFDMSFRSSFPLPYSVNQCNVQQGTDYRMQSNENFRTPKDFVSDMNKQCDVSQNFNNGYETEKFPSDFLKSQYKNSEWASKPYSNHHLNNFNDMNYTRNSSVRNKMHQNYFQSNTLKNNSKNFAINRGNQTRMNWRGAKFDNGNKSKMSFHNQGNDRKTFCNNKYHGKQNDFQVKQELKPYVCDTCDRAFNSEANFQAHISSHISCHFPNCQFEAHPAVVALHKKMQHDTGYADQINKLKNNEEVEKWRAERRRRFPTAANVLKRKAEEAEKEARGEVIEEKEFGKLKKPKEDQTGSRDKRRGARFKGRFKGKKHSQFRTRSDRAICASSFPSTSTNSDTDSDDDSHIKLHRFLGIFASTKNDKSEDNPINDNIEEFSTDAVKNVNCNEMVHEVLDANETASQSNDAEKDPKIQNIEVTTIEYTSDNEAPTEMPIIKEEKVINTLQNGFEETSSLPSQKSDKVLKSSKKNSKQEAKKAVNRYTDQGIFMKEGLLEKLLADQIRRERNIIMQCVRHIVNNDFFGIGKIY